MQLYSRTFSKAPNTSQLNSNQHRSEQQLPFGTNMLNVEKRTLICGPWVVYGHNK